jgi:O-antigen ligase
MIWLLGGYMWLFIHRPFEYWPVLGMLQVERVYMLLMLVYWAVVPRKGWLPNRLHLALIAFVAFLLISWLASPYAEECADTVENYAKVAVFYLLVVTTVRDEAGLRRLVQLYLGAVGLYLAHSMLEYYNGRYQWRQGISRMIGVDMTFSDPNAFAASLVLALPLTLPFWTERPRPAVRVLLLGFTASVCACVLLTGSRAGFVGLLLCGFMCLLAFGQGRRLAQRLTLLAVVGGAFAAAALVALPESLQNRFLTLIDPSYGPKNAEESASGRLDGLLYGIEAWERSPLLGFGPSSFAYSTGRGGGAHNLYGQILSEVGLLGALAFVGIVAGFGANWVEARRRARRLPGRGRDLAFQVSRAVGLDVVLLLFLGWAGHNLYRYNWLWFASFQIVAVHCIRAKASSPGAGRRLPYLVGPRRHTAGSALRGDARA